MQASWIAVVFSMVSFYMMSFNLKWFIEEPELTTYYMNTLSAIAVFGMICLYMIFTIYSRLDHIEESKIFTNKIGGRKRRKKNPKSVLNPSHFTFDGKDFNVTTVVFYFSDLASDVSINVINVIDTIDGQEVQFDSPVIYNSEESVYFEIEE